jgi:hypothetical protein
MACEAGNEDVSLSPERHVDMSAETACFIMAFS